MSLRSPIRAFIALCANSRASLVPFFASVITCPLSIPSGMESCDAAQRMYAPSIVYAADFSAAYAAETSDAAGLSARKLCFVDPQCSRMDESVWPRRKLQNPLCDLGHVQSPSANIAGMPMSPRCHLKTSSEFFVPTRYPTQRESCAPHSSVQLATLHPRALAAKETSGRQDRAAHKIIPMCPLGVGWGARAAPDVKMHLAFSSFSSQMSLRFLLRFLCTG